jgi:hypothetical protein
MNFFWDLARNGMRTDRVCRTSEPYASRSFMSTLPLVPPLFPAGKEPLPPGFTENDRQVMLQNKRMQNYMQMGMESCLAKTTLAAGMGAQPSRPPTRRSLSLCVVLTTPSDCRFRNGSLHLINVLLVCVRRSFDPTTATGHWGHFNHRKGEGNFC